MIAQRESQCNTRRETCLLTVFPGAFIMILRICNPRLRHFQADFLDCKGLFFVEWACPKGKDTERRTPK